MTAYTFKNFSLSNISDYEKVIDDLEKHPYLPIFYGPTAPKSKNILFWNSSVKPMDFIKENRMELFRDNRLVFLGQENDMNYLMNINYCTSLTTIEEIDIYFIPLVMPFFMLLSCVFNYNQYYFLEFIVNLQAFTMLINGMKTFISNYKNVFQFNYIVKTTTSPMEFHEQFDSIWKKVLKCRVQSSRVGNVMSHPHAVITHDMSSGKFPVWSKGSFSKLAMRSELSILFGGSRIRGNDGRMMVGNTCLEKFWETSAGPQALQTLKLSDKLVPYELGATYGFQMRFFGENYPATQFNFKSDQLLNAILTLRNDPFNRRIVLNLFNTTATPIVIQPCMHSFTFTYNTDKKLCLFVNQRSSDISVAMSYNIYTAAYFLLFMCAMTGLEPGIFTWFAADPHVYVNNKQQAIDILNGETSALPFYQYENMTDTHLTPDEDGARALDTCLENFDVRIFGRHQSAKMPKQNINGVSLSLTETR